MPVTLQTGIQTRWKDSCASSVKAACTVIANGEEAVSVYANGAIVPAGIQAPTVLPVATDGGGGSLAAGYVYYCYCYASSQYPNVEADITAGGETWPKSNPSPVSVGFLNTASHSVDVTCTKTTQPGIDQILIYRVGPDNTAAAQTTGAAAQAAAGNLSFVGSVANNGIAGTVTFLDNVVAPQELMELDNYPAPEFWFTVFAGNRWYGFGNPDLDASVTLANSTAITASAGTFFPGRAGQNVTFDGITSGGYDGQGTYFFKYLSDSVANVTVNADGTGLSTIGATGTTIMHVRGFSSTLYRSKEGNPFAWGFPESQNQGGVIVRVPQTFANNLGGYGVAMIVLPDQQLLKLDLERPALSVAIDFSTDLEGNFNSAKRTIDTRYIVTAQHSQFASQLPGGATAVRGIDTSNFSIVQGDGGNQGPVSEEVFQILRQIQPSGDVGRRFHGVYDTFTELSAFWFKTAIDPSGLIDIDTCLLFHGPTGKWSLLRDLDVTASAAIEDNVTHEKFTVTGNSYGQIARAFSTGTYSNLFDQTGISQGQVTILQIPAFTTYQITINSSVSGGQYFDIYSDPVTIDRFWFFITFSGTAPAVPQGGRLIEVASNSGFPSSVRVNLITAMQGAGYTSVSQAGGVISATAPQGGPLLPSPGATAPVTITQSYTPGTPELLAGQIAISSDGSRTFTNKSGAWLLVSNADGTNEGWARISSGPGNSTPLVISTDRWFNPATLAASAYPGSYPQVGQLVRIGIIDCEAQTYFQPAATQSGMPQEVWATIQNVDALNQWGRIYQEFDLTTSLAPFQLQRTTRQSGTPSDNWQTIQIPTTLVEQFGLRIIERGYGQFRLLGYTVKGIQPS